MMACGAREEIKKCLRVNASGELDPETLYRMVEFAVTDERSFAHATSVAPRDQKIDSKEMLLNMLSDCDTIRDTFYKSDSPDGAPPLRPLNEDELEGALKESVIKELCDLVLKRMEDCGSYEEFNIDNESDLKARYLEALNEQYSKPGDAERNDRLVKSHAGSVAAFCHYILRKYDLYCSNLAVDIWGKGVLGREYEGEQRRTGALAWMLGEILLGAANNFGILAA
jgi:hypothetical protein